MHFATQNRHLKKRGLHGQQEEFVPETGTAVRIETPEQSLVNPRLVQAGWWR